MKRILDTDQKALEINIHDKIYGTFAEIGAGQEVARHFFNVGAAAGTIAKSMSAYDKIFSDRIYGEEESGRYVCLSRLKKMLDHEYGLIIERLENTRPDANFFAFADTIAAIDFHKTVKGRGWMGLRFQLHPDGEPNDMILHVRMLDNDTQLQQEAIGILGVNMLFGCYHHHDDPELLIQSLKDNVKDRLMVDMIDLDGPDFHGVDDRLLSLYLVKNGLSPFAMFDSVGHSIHPEEFCYKKSMLVVRGNYRPPTNVTLDACREGYDMFKKMNDLSEENAFLMAELTLDNLSQGGSINEEDFISRVECLRQLGLMTIISDCKTHQVLLNYLKDYKIDHLGLVIGVKELEHLIESKRTDYSEGGLLKAFGEFFSHNIGIFVYPTWNAETQQLMTGKSLEVPDDIKYLYMHLLQSGNLHDIDHYELEKLKVLPPKILSMIRGDKEGWQAFLPEELSRLIMDKCLFGYPCHPMEFEI